MTTTVHLPEHECKPRGWQITTTGPAHMSLTITTADGTSLMIDDVETVAFLHDACGQYLANYRTREDANEDYAHQLNAFLDCAHANVEHARRAQDDLRKRLT